MNTYKYDHAGNKVECESSNGDNDGKIFKYYYKYDSKGYLIEEINWDNDKTTYKYDDNDNKIEDYTYSADGTSSKEGFQYNYDNKGNWIECVNYIDGKPIYIIERKLDYYQ